MASGKPDIKILDFRHQNIRQAGYPVSGILNIISIGKPDIKYCISGLRTSDRPDIQSVVYCI